ncbi:peptide deformylase [Cetobacterium sp. SF1]|uniref:peptide deformylase n=1 Tax=unclassified Cetobacterium TaxID=2630983 RepID=UPI003CF9DD58
MLYEIKIYGAESLRTVSTAVEVIDDEIREILENMVETMHDVKGVGLAAPQVGINKRMFVIDVGDDKVRKVINPELLELSDKIEDCEEGCLSVPGIYKSVKRSTVVKVKYTDENGNEIIEEADGLLARAFQHEYDHLEAILFVDKVSPIAKRMISKKLQLLKKDSIKK